MSVVTFNEKIKGWSSFHKYYPEGILDLNSSLYTFKNGQIYLHNSENATRNTFYGVSNPSKISLVINDEPTTVKVVQSLSLQGNNPWEVLIKAYVDNTDSSIDSTIKAIEFVQKEGVWYAYTRRGENVGDNYDTKSIYGIGEVSNKSGNDLTVPLIPIGTSVGDSIVKFDAGTGIDTVSTITNIIDNVITVSDSSLISQGDFIMGYKDPRIEGSPLRGYAMRVDLESDVYSEMVELFSVDYEIVKSYM